MMSSMTTEVYDTFVFDIMLGSQALIDEFRARLDSLSRVKDVVECHQAQKTTDHPPQVHYW